MYLSMLDKLLAYSEEHSEYDSGRGYGDTILRYDRAREQTHRQLMHLKYMAGDRTGALRQYERCAAALQEELSVKPERRTKTLYEQIRADKLNDADVAGEIDGVGEDDVIPEAAVVRDVSVGHQEHVVAHVGGLPLFGRRVNRRVLAHRRVVPDDDLTRRAPILEILGEVPDHGAVVDLAAGPDGGAPLDDRVEPDARPFPEHDPRSDVREGPDLDARTQLGAFLDELKIIEVIADCRLRENRLV